jgi:hypothetical protein
LSSLAVVNQGRFYDRFDHGVPPSAPIEVLLDRVATRTSNPYGRTADQQTEIRRYVAEVEPLLRRGVTLDLDARHPVQELADALERLPDDHGADTAGAAPTLTKTRCGPKSST